METTTDGRTQSEIRWWSIASYALLAAFLVAAVLNYYDPLDILAFAAGVGVCYGFDKRALRKHAGASLSKS